MRSPVRLLSLSIAAALTLTVVALPASAQDSSSHGNRSSQGKKDAQDAPRYPNATRKEPKPKVSDENRKKLAEISAAYSAQDYAKVQSLSTELLPKTVTPYEKSLANEIVGSAAFALKDYAAAATAFQQAITDNGLDNNGHYDSMSNLVASLSNSGKYPEALKALDQFISETKTTDPQYANMRLSLLAHTGKAGDAEAAYKERLTKNPDDHNAFQNLLATYQQQNKTAEMLTLQRDRYKQGRLDTATDLRNYYVTLLQDPEANWKEAQEVVDTGVAKGTIPKNDDTATAYSVIAQTVLGHYQEGLALADYAKAASMSSNGKADLNRASILFNQGKKAEAKAAAQEALKKGVKNPTAAQRFLK